MKTYSTLFLLAVAMMLPMRSAAQDAGMTMSGDKLTDKSFVMKVTSTPMPHHSLPKKQKKPVAFNPKKDLVNRYIIYPQSDGGHKIIVVNKKGKVCDMSAFKLEPLSDNVISEQREGYQSYCSVQGTPEELAARQVANTGAFHLIHVPSGMFATISFEMELRSALEDHGQDRTYVMEKMPDISGTFCRVTEVKTGSMWLMRYPIKLDVSGKDGRNGFNGAPGMSGTPPHDYTDKDGKKHHVKGTCGTAGGNGGNGEPGQNGGHIVLYQDDRMRSADYELDVHGGKGGRGGAGGIGGTHAAESGCRGRAADGRPGRNGADGKDGSAKVKVVSVEGLEAFNAALPTPTLISGYFYIR